MNMTALFIAMARMFGLSPAPQKSSMERTQKALSGYLFFRPGFLFFRFWLKFHLTMAPFGVGDTIMAQVRHVN